MKLGPPIFGLLTYWLMWPMLKLALRRTKRTRAFISCGDEIVVTKAWLGNGRWSLPGGGIKTQESEQQGLQRELQEETGLIINQDQLKKVADMTYRHNGLQFPFALYRISLSKKMPVQSVRSEVIAVRWINVADLNTGNASSDVLQAISFFHPLEK